MKLEVRDPAKRITKEELEEFEMEKSLVLKNDLAETLDLEQIKLLCLYGHTDAFIAKFLNVSISKWEKFKREHPDIMRAVKEWKLEADERVEKALYQRAVGYVHPEEIVKIDKDGAVHKVPTLKSYPPDPSACIFWLKNRRPEFWKEKVEHKIEGHVDHDHAHNVPAIELADRLNALMEKKLEDVLR